MGRPEEARDFAIKAHGAQRYGPHPYGKHLTDVVGVLKRFGVVDEDLLCAGWLHDTLEDTETPESEVRRLFGDRVAKLVAAVTLARGVAREPALVLAYEKIRATKDAVTVKLADRIANVEASLEPVHPGKLAKYRTEHPHFRESLHSAGGDPKMWAHLDALIAGRHEFRPLCATCRAEASTIQLFEDSGKWRLIYSGPGGSSGSGVDLAPERARAIVAGFTEPYVSANIRAAGFYDDGGFCLQCSRFYCFEHWHPSSTGGGKCPEGHFKSLDPHWSPD
jgi:hypothetical protein